MNMDAPAELEILCLDSQLLGECNILDKTTLGRISLSIQQVIIFLQAGIYNIVLESRVKKNSTGKAGDITSLAHFSNPPKVIANGRL